MSDVTQLLDMLPDSSLILLVVVTSMLTLRISNYLQKERHEYSQQSHQEILKRLDDVELEVLRVQILTGIDSGRLSGSELTSFLERYKRLGGNSFVQYKADDYLKKVEEC